MKYFLNLTINNHCMLLIIAIALFINSCDPTVVLKIFFCTFEHDLVCLLTYNMLFVSLFLFFLFLYLSFYLAACLLLPSKNSYTVLLSKCTSITPRCPKTNMNFRIKTGPVTIGTDATVYFWFLGQICVI